MGDNNFVNLTIEEQVQIMKEILESLQQKTIVEVAKRFNVLTGEHMFFGVFKNKKGVMVTFGCSEFQVEKGRNTSKFGQVAVSWGNNTSSFEFSKYVERYTIFQQIVDHVEKKLKPLENDAKRELF